MVINMENKLEIIKDKLSKLGDESFMFVHNTIHAEVLGTYDMEIYNEDLFNEYITNGYFMVNPFELICYSNCNGDGDYICFDDVTLLLEDCYREDKEENLIDELEYADDEDIYDEALEIIDMYC